MNNKFDILKALYDEILKLSCEISDLIQEHDLEKISPAIQHKEEKLKQAYEMKNSLELSSEQVGQLEPLINKIRETELSNIEFLKSARSEIQKELVGLQKNKKVLSAYKDTYTSVLKNPQPRVIDIND